MSRKRKEYRNQRRSHKPPAPLPAPRGKRTDGETLEIGGDDEILLPGPPLTQKSEDRADAPDEEAFFEGVLTPEDEEVFSEVALDSKSNNAVQVVSAGGGFPAVALVGRPNVGKSSLFNALLRREISITDARPGTTRDNVLHPLEVGGKPCDLVDTGGIGGEGYSGGGDGVLPPDLIKTRINAALATADVLIFVVDAQDGLTTADRAIAAQLRRLNRPLLLVANKTESQKAQDNIVEFDELGLGAAVGTSAAHRLGLDDLENALAALLPAPVAGDTETDWESIPRLAVIGRRNVGKSSFVNRISGKEQTIVSTVPGTTRDAVDVLVERRGRRFCLIDTAGLRRLRQSEGPVDFFAQVRSERAVRRADVVLLMISGVDGLTHVDLKTADFVVKHFKPCVLIVNKWDLVRGRTKAADYADYLFHRLPDLSGSPICFVSAKHGTRCTRPLQYAFRLHRLSRTKIPTSRLNVALETAETAHEPPVFKQRKPRLLYGVQVGVSPPTFVVYCRHAKYIEERYQRYLRRRLSELLEMQGAPFRLFLREAERKRK